MTQHLITFGIYSVILFAGMLFGEFLYRILKLNTEWTRKIIHVSSGIVSLSYPSFIDVHWIVLAITINFTIILYTSKKMGWFNSIFDVGRKSYGTLFFVWSTWLLFILSEYFGDNFMFFYLGFSPVVFADPAAALIGKPLPFKKFTIFGNTKSLGGSFSFFIITFVLTYFILNYVGTEINILLFSLIHAIILTVVEAISSKGTDNFTIPVASIFIVFITSLIF